MAVNKTINKRTNTHGAMRNCIEYVLRQDKTNELFTCVTGPYCHDEINYDLVYRTFLEEKKESAVPAAAVLPQQLHEPVPEAAAEYIFCRSAAYNLQPRHGRSRTSGRPLLRFPVCTGRFYKIKCPLRRIRTRKCQPVFPYPRFG